MVASSFMAEKLVNELAFSTLFAQGSQNSLNATNFLHLIDRLIIICSSFLKVQTAFGGSLEAH